MDPQPFPKQRIHIRQRVNETEFLCKAVLWKQIISLKRCNYAHECETLCFTMDPEAGAPVQWLKLPATKSGDRGFEPHSDLQRNKMFLPRSHVRIQHYGEPP